MQGFGLDSHKKSWAEESTRVGGNLGPGQRELVPKKRSLYPGPPSSPRQTNPGWCQRPGRPTSPSSRLWSLYHISPSPARPCGAGPSPPGRELRGACGLLPPGETSTPAFCGAPEVLLLLETSGGCWTLQRRVLGPIPPPLELPAQGWAGSDPGLYLHPPIPS